MAAHPNRNSSTGLKRGLAPLGRALKSASHHSKKKLSHRDVRAKEESDDDMMGYVENYCMECDSRMLPGQLKSAFCSRECSLRDREKRNSSSAGAHSGSTPVSPYADVSTFQFDDDLSPTPNIVAPRAPTSPSTSTRAYSPSAISGDNGARHDSFPCEPAETTPRPPVTRNKSAAETYLDKFFKDGAPPPSSRPVSHHSRRPRSVQLASQPASAAPSLSTSPSSYFASGRSLPYTPRSYGALELPSRDNPYSLSSRKPKSVDLVSPLTQLTTPDFPEPLPGMKSSPTVATTTEGWSVAGRLQYEKASMDIVKQRAAHSASPGTGSLTQLFASTSLPVHQ